MNKALIMFTPLVFLIGLLIGSISHPYEQCKRMYETPEDISECVYLLTDNDQ